MAFQIVFNFYFIQIVLAYIHGYTGVFHKGIFLSISYAL